jgi:nucleotide-binding universal stress UspA family protein
MPTLDSILCPIDFSEPSQLALRVAIALAARYRSRLTVLAAVDPLLAEAAKVKLGLNLARTETEPALGEFVKGTLPADAPWAPAIALEVRVGDADDAIVAAAAREAAHLVVMGTHGFGGFRKMLLGSTTERVLRRTRTPILAVPPLAVSKVVIEPSGARFEPGPILVGTDFSASSTAAVRWGWDLAQDFAVPLLLMHVVDPVRVLERWQPFVEEFDESRVAEARAKLTRLAADAPARCTCETVVALGRPADTIASTAEERAAGLIVVGLAGDQGRLAPRPGSIAYRVLCLSKVPVLVVPPQGSASQ